MKKLKETKPNGQFTSSEQLTARDKNSTNNKNNKNDINNKSNTINNNNNNNNNKMLLQNGRKSFRQMLRGLYIRL